MTVFFIAFRRIVRAKRTWALAALPILGVVGGIFALTKATATREAYGGFTKGLLIPIIIALVAFVVAASAVTDEREDLTILYIAQTPMSRMVAVLEIWLAAWTATLLMVAAPLVVGILLARNAGLGFASVVDLVVACTAASAAYCALGVLAAFYTKRAAIVGLVYVLLWESIMSGFAAGARNLSVAQHARSIAARSVDPWTRMELSPPSTGAGVALVVLMGTVAGSLLLAGRRFRRMNLP